MTPDWKKDLLHREPIVVPTDPEAEQRIQLASRAQFFETAATKWCLEAGREHYRAMLWMRVSFVLAVLLVLAVSIIVWRLL